MVFYEIKDDMVTPFLSIIIPAYNESRRLPQTLERINQFILTQSYHTEVIVIENGSSDETYQIGYQFAQIHPEFKIFSEKERGKGLAVRRGMMEAKGAYRFMCDADLSMPIEETNRFLPPLLDDFDIAIASREAPGSERFNEPLYRHLGGRGVNAMIQLLALPGLHDTQCGFKCFEANVAMDLFTHLSLTGWSFDIELLFIARRRGYRIVEVPIPWFFNPDSKVSTVKDAVQMGIDILKIWRNQIFRKYTPTRESNIQASR